MFRILLLLIIVVPALEIGLLILSGKTFGLLPTILLIIATGVVGAWLAKKQGLEVIKQARQDMDLGYAPGESIIDGICILVGGIMLLAPGFVTDLIGFLLLFPISRRMIKPLIKKGMTKMMENGQFFIIGRR